MDSYRIDMFMTANNKYFEQHQLPQLRERLKNMEDSQWEALQMIQFKDPTISLVISIIIGELGIDRFYVGDIGLGILKLLTCGGFGIWYIVDWFLIMGRTRERNMQMLNESLG